MRKREVSPPNVHESGTDAGSRSPSTSVPPRAGWFQTVSLFVILSAFWYLLSGRIGLQYALFMLATVGIVMWMNPERPFRGADERFTGVGVAGRLRAVKALLRYLVWLVWNVIKANVEVARLILHPRLPIRPQLLMFRTTLTHDLAKVLVANSITLTPGTVTIDLRDDQYLVHSLAPKSAGAVTGAGLQNVVAPIFSESPDPVPEVTWARSYREMNW